MSRGTVILLSGGIDSTVVLAQAVAAGKEIDCLTVDYGQRHRREIDAARAVAKHYGVRHTVASIDSRLFAGSALTNDMAVPEGHAESPDATYVPARNTVLLALAAARAESIGARSVEIGCNSDDAAGYPDCRPSYVESFRDVLQAGTVGHVWVSAPLIYLSKAQIIEVAKSLEVPLGLTWSCYEGLAAGPCGRCGACQAREALCP